MTKWLLLKWKLVCENYQTIYEFSEFWFDETHSKIINNSSKFKTSWNISKHAKTIRTIKVQPPKNWGPTSFHNKPPKIIKNKYISTWPSSWFSKLEGFLPPQWCWHILCTLLQQRVCQPWKRLTTHQDGKRDNESINFTTSLARRVDRVFVVCLVVAQPSRDLFLECFDWNVRCWGFRIVWAQDRWFIDRSKEWSCTVHEDMC